MEEAVPKLKSVKTRKKIRTNKAGPRRGWGALSPSMGVGERTLVLKDRLERCACSDPKGLSRCLSCNEDSKDFQRTTRPKMTYYSKTQIINVFTKTPLHHGGLIDRLMAEVDKGVAEEDLKPFLRIDETRGLYRQKEGTLKATLFVHSLLHRMDMAISLESVLMGLVLLERIKRKRQDLGGLALASANMRSLLLGVMMICHKTHDQFPHDLRYWGRRDYMNLDVQGMKCTEALLLRLFEWDVVVRPWQITRYLFERGIMFTWRPSFDGLPKL